MTTVVVVAIKEMMLLTSGSMSELTLESRPVDSDTHTPSILSAVLLPYGNSSVYFGPF